LRSAASHPALTRPEYALSCFAIHRGQPIRAATATEIGAARASAVDAGDTEAELRAVPVGRMAAVLAFRRYGRGKSGLHAGRMPGNARRG